MLPSLAHCQAALYVIPCFLAHSVNFIWQAPSIQIGYNIKKYILLKTSSIYFIVEVNKDVSRIMSTQSEIIDIIYEFNPRIVIMGDDEDE